MARKTHGFTILELIIVIAAIAILAAIAVPSLIVVIDKSKIAADTANVKVLNNATAVYRAQNDITGDVFAGIGSDAGCIQVLIDAKLLSETPVPKEEDAAFKWDAGSQLWRLYVGGEAAPLTALGSTFTEISSAMIQLEADRKTQTGSYGRSWGDYAYTDLGLVPSDWQMPVGHILYKPGGSRVMVAPETGYTFIVQSLSGTEKKLPASYNWNLVYDCASSIWYYHRIESGNEVDIETLQVVPS